MSDLSTSPGKASDQISIRPAGATDIDSIADLTFEHGASEWNHLPVPETRAHYDKIATGETLAVVAICDEQIVGIVSYNIGNFYPQYEAAGVSPTTLAYIAEAVVHRDYAGKGIGSRLMNEAKEALRKKGVEAIYVKRHENNLGSAGMMRKAGFEIVDVFPDPIRTSGSKRTTIERFRFVS